MEDGGSVVAYSVQVGQSRMKRVRIHICSVVGYRMVKVRIRSTYVKSPLVPLNPVPSN